MSDTPYVSLVPKDLAGKLREILTQEDTGALHWREARFRRESEFYFSGPPDLVRLTHEFVTLWLANQKIAKRIGKTAKEPAHRPWTLALVRAASAAAAMGAFAFIAFSSSAALG